MKVTVLNGPNLNLLGQRQPQIYGAVGLPAIEKNLKDTALEFAVTLEFLQSNKEYELVEKIQSLMQSKEHYIILNPAAFTHTSVAIRDALQATQVPFIEVHLSNIYAREEFRKHSYFSDIALGTISGLGANGYNLALLHIIKNYLK